MKKNKIFKKFVGQKQSGDSNYIAAVISLFFLVVLFVGMINIFGLATKMNDVNRVHRKYLIRMERDGCLTGSEQAQLLTELQGLGCTNIVLTGTSMVPVGYANKVRLVIECDVPKESIGFATGSPKKEAGVEHIVIDKSATALY